MFLDEKLLKIGRGANLETQQGISNAVSQMINACFENLSKSLEKHRDDQTILSNFNRVNKTWIGIAKILDDDGKGFIKIDGFKIFVEPREEFKGIFFN